MSQQTVERNEGLVVNSLMRNVYALLSVIVGLAALAAFSASAFGMPMIPWWAMLIGFYGLLFLTEATKNSVLGLASVSLLAVFMGATLSPVLYSLAQAGHGNIIGQAFAGTAFTFVGLSLYALSSKKDFRSWTAFIVTGIIVGFLAGIGAILFSIPALSLAVSAIFILLMSGMILIETSSMIHEPNQNYISVTVGLFVTLYNLFTSLLHVLLAVSGDD